MAELRSSTSVGGNLVWHSGNLRFDVQGDTIRYGGYKIFTEYDTPHPSELGNGANTSAYTKDEADAAFQPYYAPGYVLRDGDVMNGSLGVSDYVDIAGNKPYLQLTESDTGKLWYVATDANNFNVYEDNLSTTRMRLTTTTFNVSVSDFQVASRNVFTVSDNWLRINDQNAWTSGVYFGNSTVRTDGVLKVGATQASGLEVNPGSSVFTWKSNVIFHDGYHPNADVWTTPRTLTLDGSVVGSAVVDGSGDVTITTAATSSPTLTLDGDVTGSATFTELNDATLTVDVLDDSHTHDSRYYTEAESDGKYWKYDFATNADYPALGMDGSGKSDWVRTNEVGLLPYANGGNSSSLGSTNWPFKDVFAVEFHENGTSLTSKYHSKNAAINFANNSQNLLYTTNDTGLYWDSDATEMQFRFGGIATTKFKMASGNITTDGVLYASGMSTTGAIDVAGTGKFDGRLTVNNGAPDLLLQDTDGKSGFLHVNSNNIYLLRSASNNGTTWDSGPNNRHPMTLNMDNGNVTFSGNVIAYSDERLKKDVKVIDSALDKVTQLNGVYYNWIRDDAEVGTQIGVIAQNVEEVFPEAVFDAQNGDLAVAHGNLIGPLIEAIKELNEKVDAQASTIEKLRRPTVWGRIKALFDNRD